MKRLWQKANKRRIVYEGNRLWSIPGSAILGGVSGKKAIVMAANIRIATVARGIFKAAKDPDSAVFMELARSESDLKGGYTGMTPREFSERMKEAAQATQFDIWALHADHITVKPAMQWRLTRPNS